MGIRHVVRFHRFNVFGVRHRDEYIPARNAKSFLQQWL